MATSFHLLMIGIIVSNLCLSTGSLVRFTNQTVLPTRGGDDHCTVECEQDLEGVSQPVLDIEIFDISRGGRKLAKVFAHSGKQILSDDVNVVGRTFSCSVAKVELAINDQETCDRGSFLCVVNYDDLMMGRDSDVTVVRPNAEGLMSNDLLDKMDALTNTMSDMQTTLSQLKKTFKTCVASSLGDQEWKLAFRGTAGIGKSVYWAYKDGAGIPSDVESGCKQVGQNLTCNNHYRNNEIMDNWKGISDVAFVVYKNNVKVREVILDGTGSTYMDWMAQSRVKYSTWTDLKSIVANIFSIPGDRDGEIRRTFFMNQVYRGCAFDVGWFIAVDSVDTTYLVCQWEKVDAYPALMFSPINESMNWNNAGIALADYFGILVRF